MSCPWAANCTPSSIEKSAFCNISSCYESFSPLPVKIITVFHSFSNSSNAWCSSLIVTVFNAFSFVGRFMVIVAMLFSLQLECYCSSFSDLRVNYWSDTVNRVPSIFCFKGNCSFIIFNDVLIIPKPNPIRCFSSKFRFENTADIFWLNSIPLSSTIIKTLLCLFTVTNTVFLSCCSGIDWMAF
jgi:hypothetical protein